MPAKEAKARIKINNLLQESGWRLIDDSAGKANVVLENNVKITHTVADDMVIRSHPRRRTKAAML